MLYKIAIIFVNLSSNLYVLRHFKWFADFELLHRFRLLCICSYLPVGEFLDQFEPHGQASCL